MYAYSTTSVKQRRKPLTAVCFIKPVSTLIITVTDEYCSDTDVCVGTFDEVGCVAVYTVIEHRNEMMLCYLMPEWVLNYPVFVVLKKSVIK